MSGLAGFDRRSILRIAGVAFCSCCTATPFSALARGKDIVFCVARRSLAASDGEYGVPLARAYDIPVVRYIEQEQAMLEAFFGLRSSKIFVRTADRGVMVTVPGESDARADGRIVFGALEIDNRLNQRFGMLQLSGILAHEAAHLFQIATKTHEMLAGKCGFSVKMIELHADYLAGSYMASRGRDRPGAPDELAAMFFHMGDRDTAERGTERDQHHGEHRERFLAFTRGYQDSAAMIRQSATLDVTLAAAKGILYANEVCT